MHFCIQTTFCGKVQQLFSAENEFKVKLTNKTTKAPRILWSKNYESLNRKQFHSLSSFIIFLQQEKIQL